MATISAVIITKNESRYIEKCLDSLQDVADEIIVVDSFSDDETPAICKAKGVKFYQMEWKGFSETKNYANSLAKGDYILSIDGDEVLSKDLIASILKKNGNLSGIYSFNRLNHYLGDPVRCCGWYPDRKIRLFPKDGTVWKGEVHEELIFPNNPTESHLEGDLLHYPYDSVEEHLRQTKKYAELGAKKIAFSDKRNLALKSLINPIWRWIRMYFFAGGFKAGKAGWIISRMAMKEVALKYKRAIQLRKKRA